MRRNVTNSAISGLQTSELSFKAKGKWWVNLHFCLPYMYIFPAQVDPIRYNYIWVSLISGGGTVWTEVRSGDHEARCLKRKLLLEALAKDLPAGTIRYSSKVVCIEESGFFKLLHLADGTILKTKVNLYSSTSRCFSVFVIIPIKFKNMQCQVAECAC